MTAAAFIVEDNAVKRTAIERALIAVADFEIQATPSIAQAYRALEGRKWDLVILDMTFQVSLGFGNETTKEALAGIELMQYMKRRRINVPVIVATQHSSFASPDMPGIDSIDKLHDLLERLFPKIYRETVEVNLSEDAWKAHLQTAVMKVLNERESKNPSRGR